MLFWTVFDAHIWSRRSLDIATVLITVEQVFSTLAKLLFRPDPGKRTGKAEIWIRGIIQSHLNG